MNRWSNAALVVAALLCGGARLAGAQNAGATPAAPAKTTATPAKTAAAPAKTTAKTATTSKANATVTAAAPKDSATTSHNAPAKPKAAKPGVISTMDSLIVLQRQVAKDSTNFDLLYRLGLTYLDRDRGPDAVAVLYKAHQLRPKDVPTLVNLGAAYDAEGAQPAAQQMYGDALKLAPGDSIATCRLASSLYSQGKFPEAMDHLRSLIANKPNAYCAYFFMGIGFADAGVYREAIRMWRKVIELAPESPEAISARESIEVLEKYVKLQ